MFQKTIIKKYLKTQDSQTLQEKWIEFQNHFHNTIIQDNIRNSKEEQYQEGFLRDLFVNIFGYILNPTVGFNLTTELRNIKDAKKADGGILIEEHVVGVIELKGTNTTDLGKVEQQAFNYKNNQTGCVYVITSNFEKLRFYIDDSVTFIEFNLFDLKQDDFNLLYLLLSYENIKNNIPKKIKDESLSQEDTITKKLYKDYSLFKRELFQNLVELNPEFDQLELFKKTQKLLDRLLFLFFGEDRGLLPPNSVRQILEQWNKLNELDECVPLYNRYKKYFGYLNTGYKGKHHDVFAYNGGLFKADEILDNIKIDDQLLYKHSLKLSEYDFASEVDVNILGHIFENSLNEIDEIKSQLEGKEVDKSKTKRKKDGVFYTPKYITKYIVENTVGKLCEEKKTEFGIIEEDYFTDKKRQQKTKENLLKKLDDYREWLLHITIVDPACGSGAFLNEALNFLIDEHQYIDELESKLTGSSISFSYQSESILENNLFGVDLNEESVEIAKLSLWLRTAEPNRKLNSLNDNIKCGNSLIDDPNVAADKAFIWEKEFPQVFGRGGFDVVIGNPPYVRQELFKEIKPYLELNYECYNSIADLYTYFIEKGFKILNSKGIFSFILPNKFLKANYGKEVRKFISNQNNLELIYDFDDYPVFADATTYPIIYLINKNWTNDYFKFSAINKRSGKIDPIKTLINNEIEVAYLRLDENQWTFSDNNNSTLLLKICENSRSLKDVVDDKIFRGVSTGKNEVFIITEEIAKNLINDRNKHLIRKVVTGKEVKRNCLTFDNLYLLFISWEYDLDFDDNIKNYLLDRKSILESRPEVKEGRFNWWCLSRYGSKNAQYLFKPKIIYPRINNQCNFYYDSTGEYSLSDNNFFISTEDKYLLPILNSKLIFYYLKSIASTLQGGYLDFRRPSIETIPIKSPNDPEQLSKMADLMEVLNKQLQELPDKFQRTLEREFDLDNLSKKLQFWYLLSYKDFLKELAKQKVTLSLSQKSEWEDYFESEKIKVLEVRSQIDATDKEIDKMVYELYGLTEEEIAIVENS
ncbi:TaqI-like C-terminal specificity domain-containing protein [Chryseobacterium sp. HSC-36S06]|uniref:Eco57I restriction-modification methylase domain-containing protein n=1 Tax=Chryseobacterium sp. HSC-36S06 TaxID=2910970 RepID=UPI00209D7613|nr:TaqI-like C-terminal specificity domain-containing protein [Chryseobacterium sp. HSC-36S06]MCP2037319.1 hypothetical protein [Chryseobacterium sp. HSC-36S06]